MSDTELLNWLEKNGDGYALVSDDNGHWVCTCSGMQNVPMGDGPVDITTQHWIEAHEWKNSIREAIAAAISECEESDET